MAVTANNTGEILTRAFQPEQATLSDDAARSILAINFSDEDRVHMDHLAKKARQGTLSASEQVELDNYEHVNNLLAILKSKARRSLKPGNAETSQP